MAALWKLSEGTKHRSARGCSQKGCGVARSVTTVTKGMRRAARAPGCTAAAAASSSSRYILRSTLMGTAWQSGCIEITTSGECSRMHCSKPL